MEVKQFTSTQFADAFEGSATDLLTKMAAQPAVPAAPVTAPVTVQPVVTGTPVKQEPLTGTPTLDEGRDAAALLADQNPPTGDEPPTEPDPEDATAIAAKAAAAEAAKKAGRPAVKKLDAGTKTLVENLIKENKLFGFQDGKIETERDLQELLDANFEHRDQTKVQEAYQNFMNSLSPAFQMVAQYANMVDSPAQLIPLLQSTNNAERFATLDENNPVHQEMIVRERMRLNGDTDDIIEQEITDLKDRAKLADKAKVYKPVISKFYAEQANHLIQQQQQEEQQNFQLIQQNGENLRKMLDTPELDGIKLGKNHKGAIYEMLAVPREEYGGGMGIYHVIDELFQRGDFKRLSKIALLAADEKAFEEVMGMKLKFANADSTIRALNVSSKGGSPTQVDTEPDNEGGPVRLQRPNRSGFGFSR